MTTAEQLVWARDEGLCFKCGAVLSSYWPGYSCHHRQLKSGGGSDTPENRVMLCGSGVTGDHGWAHAIRAEAQELGFIVSRYANPADVPVKHWRLGMVYLTADGRIITMADMDAAASEEETDGT